MSTKQQEVAQPTGDRVADPVTGPLDEKILAKHEEHEEKVKVRGDYSGAVAKTDPMEKKLVKKLDIWIMPMLWLMYWLNFLDRNAITLARLNGFEEELGLTSTQYSTSISILFVGYILGQIPSNMIITRVRPSWYMGTCMMGWAVISGLTAITKNYTGVVLTRFFLGVVEAPYYPGALYLLGIFYTRKEIATRISILYSGNILASSFAGLIALGVFELDGKHGLSGWRWLFIIQGIATFVVAVAACFLLPDEPLKTWWLTPEERQLAYDRVARDTVGITQNVSMWSGLLEALKDPKVWVFVVMQHLHIGTAGFKNFLPSVISTLNFNQKITLVLTCPPYLLAGAISVAYAMSSGHFNERTYHITAAKILAIFGFVLGCTTLNIGARYFAMCVFTIGTYCVNSLILGWVASSCGQTKEKKASALAIANVSATLSLIWTPYIWPKSAAPLYAMPMGISAGMAALCAAGAWWMRWMLIRQNRKIRATDSETTLLYAY